MNTLESFNYGSQHAVNCCVVRFYSEMRIVIIDDIK